MLGKYFRVPKKFLPRQGADFPESRASDLSAPLTSHPNQSAKDLLQTDKQIKKNNLADAAEPNKQTWVRLRGASGLVSPGCPPSC